MVLGAAVALAVELSSIPAFSYREVGEILWIDSLPFRRRESLHIVIGVSSVLLLRFAAVAEENAPHMETFWGYTFVRTNPASSIPSFSANGGSGPVRVQLWQLVRRCRRHGPRAQGNIDDRNLDSTVANFLVGLRISAVSGRGSRLISRLYSVECNATSSTAAPELGLVADLPPGFNLRASRQETAFAMTVRRRTLRSTNTAPSGRFSWYTF
jgi:hypothetical protein